MNCGHCNDNKLCLITLQGQDLLAPENCLLLVLQLACLYFYDYIKARKGRNDASAETECKGEQSPVIMHHNGEEDEKEEAIHVRERKMQKENGIMN
ncbi:hypothetical protein XELAEV_18028653mg [Xenopus laevis]|uniref:Uncharacterized protein n=1 Tax=Xenopus laevis TaxID=8355 RepID=A0A974CSH2_XENLA|nr:hypothetical protein XELAEV_18028653mg [Xenopus laevis]